MTCTNRDAEQAAAEARNLSQLENAGMEFRTHPVLDPMGKIESFPRVKMAGT